jgi:competence protein ComGF
MPVNDQTKDKELLDYEREMQLRLEKMDEKNRIKKTILNEVESMTISEFQNAVDESRISGNTVVDEMVENLVDYLFEQRNAS